MTNEVYAILRLNQRESTKLLDEGLQQQNGLAVDELVALRYELVRALRSLPFNQQQVVFDIARVFHTTVDELFIITGD